jgi:hypothetical protein
LDKVGKQVAELLGSSMDVVSSEISKELHCDSKYFDIDSYNKKIQEWFNSLKSNAKRSPQSRAFVVGLHFRFLLLRLLLLLGYSGLQDNQCSKFAAAL